MLRRAIARGLAADARRLASSHTIALPLRDARALAPSISYLSSCTASKDTSPPSINALRVRFYATAQPARRKATGRPRKSATQTKKRKPAKKPAKKKKKPVVRKKKQPTELEAKRAKVRDLRKVALLDTPKRLPETAYLVYSTEQNQKGTNAAQQAKQISVNFRELPLREVEHFQNIAEENKRQNERTLKNWIEGQTPDQIRLANNARRQLSRIAKEPKPPGAGRALVAHKVVQLSDSRVPIKNDSPFIVFTRERWASGDFANVPAAEAAKTIGREWRSLSPSDTQKYRESAAADKARYEQEYYRLFPKRSPRKS